MEKESVLFYVVLFLFAATGIVTILGMIKKVDIEQRYLNRLFPALVLELIVAVLYMFSSTDFFKQESNNELAIIRTALPSAYKDIDTQQLLLILTTLDKTTLKVKELKEELSAQKNSISTQELSYKQISLSLDKKIAELSALEVKYKSSLKYEHEYIQLEKNFLVRMANLNTKLSIWGTSINLRWRPEEKREIAKMLQEAFKQIGFMKQDDIINDSPQKAYELLVLYQESKDFSETGFLTSQVIAMIIKDYLI